MMEADVARLAACWARACRNDEDLPHLERVLAQDLEHAAERVFVVERKAPETFRFGVASDRLALRFGFDVSGRELNDDVPWPRGILKVLERAAGSRSHAELVIIANTSFGEKTRVSFNLFPISNGKGEACGFIGFAHEFSRSGEAREEFGLITRTTISVAVLARAEPHGRFVQGPF